ncbi:Variant-specific surface protein, partial [Giardia duodenalis]
VCREARDGACVGYAEKNKTDRTSARVIKFGAEETCPKATSDSSAETGKCKKTKCDVTIGGNKYCSQCSKNNDHLIDGKCVAAYEDANSNCVNTNNQGTCTQCNGQSFMYQGGCYQTGASNPGNTLCTAASDGKCTQAAEGYFVPPGADASHDSVVSCGDTAGVTFGSGSNTKTYKGVTGCAKCSAPNSVSGNTGTAAATCTECTTNLYLKTETDGATSCVSKCPEGYFGHTAATGGLKTCQSCSGENADLTPAGAGVAGCAACTYDSAKVTCTKCETGKYLKTTSDSTSCVEASGCGPGFFPKADDKAGNKCVSCGSTSGNDGGIADCQTCTKESTTLKCLTCNSNKKPSTDGTTCVTCTVTDCATCSANDICEVCTDGYRKTDSNTCEKCTPENCKACPDAINTCTVCVSGYTLDSQTNTCVSSSANRSGLSTGAIAGISVAAVVVVGGLVGFLCWWFICRGKA